MKKLVWLGNSKKDLVEFPKEVIQEIGYALYFAQNGERYHKAKPFKGYGSGVYEIATEWDKNAYRAVYTVNVDDTVYVIHSFQKKSKHGIKTPKEEIELIRQRLKFLRSQTDKRRS